MIEQRAWPLSRRAGLALVAVLLLLAGLAAPFTGVVPADAAPASVLGTAGAGNDTLVSQLRADLAAYLRARGTAEHISAVGVSVNLPGRAATIDVSAGTTTFGGFTPVSTHALWQIGSNTKAFTSVLLLKLEAAHCLSIDDTLGRWLPQYPQWRNVSIRRLLNMTSGIATYDEQPAFQAAYVAHPRAYFSPERLVGYAVGAPATSGYSYSNTNYVLAEMIIERVTGRSYRHQLDGRLIERLDLDNLYYRPHLYPRRLTEREPAGYFMNRKDSGLSSLIGRNVSRDSLSWARGAGGIISTTGDMTRWERALYSGLLLPPKQQRELESLVSSRTGKPIARTSLSDPQGFGLGVAQLTAAGFGTFWFYEGETLGFRTLHAYFPASGLIIAIGLNSATTDDQIQLVAESVLATLQSHGVLDKRPAPAHAGA